jgi:hypothetical protein
MVGSAEKFGFGRPSKPTGINDAPVKATKRSFGGISSGFLHRGKPPDKYEIDWNESKASVPDRIPGGVGAVRLADEHFVHLRVPDRLRIVVGQ